MTVQGSKLTAELNPTNRLSVVLKGLGPTVDETGLLKALKRLNVEGVANVSVLRKAGKGDYESGFDAAVFLSLWTAIGPIESCLTFPPEGDTGKGKAYVRFSRAVDAIQAVETYNGQTGRFGSGVLHVEPDFSWSVNIPHEVYDIMDALLKAAKDRLEAEWAGRITISTVKKEGGKGVTIKVESLQPPVLTAAKGVYDPILSGHVVRGLSAREQEALFKRSGRAEVERIIKTTTCYISLDGRNRLVRLFHPEEAVRQSAEHAVRAYVSSAAQLETRTVALPAGGGPALVGADGKGLNAMQEQTGAEVTINFRRRQVVVTGTAEAVEEAAALVSARLEPLQRRATGSAAGGGGDEVCGICMCEIEAGGKAHQLIGCGHRFHHECAQRQVLSAVESKQAGLPVRCASCAVPFSLRDLSTLLSTDDMLELCRSALAKYVDEHPEELRWCPTATCSQVASIREADENRGLFQCPDCIQRYCLRCRGADGLPGVTYHDGLSCQEYQAAVKSDKAFDTWVKDWMATHDVKACPSCHTKQERVGVRCWCYADRLASKRTCRLPSS